MIPEIYADLTSKVLSKLSDEDTLKEMFQGAWGVTQSMLYFAFNRRGIDYKPFSTHSINAWYGHAIGTIDAKDGTVHVIDPTFTQFLDESDPDSPMSYLLRTQTGADILTSLMQRHCFTATPENAYTYLSSFLKGEPLLIPPDLALEILRTPPEHEYNLTYGLEDKPATQINLMLDSLYI